MLRKVGMILVAAILMAGGVACGIQGVPSPQESTPLDAKLIDAKGRASLGVLEHRGTRYELRDLLDPAYRATSEDPFARDFDPLRLLAADPVATPTIWAGR